MRRSLTNIWIAIVFIASASFIYPSPAYSFINRIEGQVFDPNRRPVENARVELRSETGSTVGNTKTSSAGRFMFSGMGPGRYTIRVMPFGTNLLEQEQETEITNVTRFASDIAFVEFVLAYDKRLRGAEPDGPGEVLFVQEIPVAARKLYQDGADDLRSDRVTGLAKLDKALEIAPKYFDALSLIGKYYVLLKNYEKAYPYLLRAIDVNPRSFSSYFRLAYAFYQLKQYPAAVVAAKAATDLSPTSFDAQSLYGTVARINENYIESEKALRKANEMANGKNAEVHMQLALLFNRLNNNQAAIGELEIYLKLEPKTPDRTQIEALIARLKTAKSK